MANVAIINKIDTADLQATEQLRDHIRTANPHALIVEAASPVTADRPQIISGRKVLVVEDGPTVTHGKMRFGAAPIDLSRLIKIRQPVVRVRYDLQEIGQPDLGAVLADFVPTPVAG
jgi:predicted GTPase